MIENLAEPGVAVVGCIATAFAFQQLFAHASYQWHKLEKMDQSATETQDTETHK